MVVDTKIDFINLAVYRQGEVVFAGHPPGFHIPPGDVRIQFCGKLCHCLSNRDSSHDGTQSVCFRMVLFQVEQHLHVFFHFLTFKWLQNYYSGELFEEWITQTKNKAEHQRLPLSEYSFPSLLKPCSITLVFYYLPV